MRTLYALLVGLNRYEQDAVSPLEGTHNDVHAWEAWMSSRDDLQVNALVLLDDAARRDAVIAGFREHLSAAREGDQAVFIYSGHGSTAPLGPRLQALAIDDAHAQTLVLHDSRTTASDLLDLELSVLIAEVAASGAEVVVVLDACHAAGATRGPAGRPRFEKAGSPRALSSTLFAASAAQPGWTLPVGRHLALCACQPDQTAEEADAGDQMRGIFTHRLLRLLTRTGGGLSYRELVGQTAAALLGRRRGQVPRLDCYHGADPDRLFLGTAQQPRRGYDAQVLSSGPYQLFAGAVHLIPPPGAEPTILHLENVADPTQQADTQLTVRHATRSELAETTPRLPLGGYRARIIHAPLHRYPVWLDPALPDSHAAQHAVRSSPFLSPASSAAASRWSVSAGPPTESVTGAPVFPVPPASAGQAVDWLEQLARWLEVLDLAPAAPSYPPDAVSLLLAQPGRAAWDSDAPGAGAARLRRDAQGTATFRLGLRNNTDDHLYVLACSMSREELSVHAFSLTGDAVSIPAGQTVWPFGDQLGRVKASGTEPIADQLKIFAAPTPIDGSLLTMAGYDRPGVTRSAPRDALERLLLGRVTRATAAADPDGWYTRLMTVITQ